MIALKSAVLLVSLFLGGSFVWEGYRSSVKGPPRETRPPFYTRLKPSHDREWGDLEITMQPENAFVVGDRISTRVDLELSLMFGESARVCIEFPEGSSILKGMEWENVSRYEDVIIQWCEYPNNTIHHDLTLWYHHEGTFGINVIIEIIVRSISIEPQSIEEFYYPDIFRIESYTYLEERRNAHSTNALNRAIFGLALVAIGPIVVQFIDLVERPTYPSKNEDSDLKKRIGELEKKIDRSRTRIERVQAHEIRLIRSILKSNIPTVIKRKRKMEKSVD